MIVVKKKQEYIDNKGKEDGPKFLKVLLTLNLKKNYFKLNKDEKEKLTIKEEQGIKYIEDNETTSYFSKKLCNISTSMKDNKLECSCDRKKFFENNEELKKLELTDQDINLIIDPLSSARLLSTDDLNEKMIISQTEDCQKVKAKGGSKKKRTIKNKKSKQKNRKSKQKNRKSKKNKKSKKIKRKKYKRKSKKI